MLVEVATGVSVADKDLFVSLCQVYERHNAEASSFSGVSSEGPSLQTLSFSSGVQGDTRQKWPECILRTPFSQWQLAASFDDKWGDFDDWDPIGS